MRAELKGMHSPDVDLANPAAVSAADDVLVQLMIGPAGDAGEEAFDLVVRASGDSAEVAGGRGFRPADHALVLDRIDTAELRRYVEDFLRDLEYPTWDELARAIGRIARWEFAVYRPVRDDGV
ncbi:Imm8 family immunity protein [Nocardia grenadensis]|uniref:Imm8 family immunity protein n=1 Tax=Nocardia grenadensis TaxID=931537 RepID=UPI000A027406|nr:Imm8 family immunity protein [Nocardia grenadensis]